jgi:hypothetical protein
MNFIKKNYKNKVCRTNDKLELYSLCFFTHKQTNLVIISETDTLPIIPISNRRITMTPNPNELIFKDLLERLISLQDSLQPQDRHTLSLLTGELKNEFPLGFSTVEKQKALQLKKNIVEAFLSLLHDPVHYKRKYWTANAPTEQSNYFFWRYQLPIWILGLAFVPTIVLLTFKACCFFTALGLLAAASLPIALAELATIAVITATFILTPLLTILSGALSLGFFASLYDNAKNNYYYGSKLNTFTNTLGELANYCQDTLLNQAKEIKPAAFVRATVVNSTQDTPQNFFYHSDQATVEAKAIPVEDSDQSRGLFSGFMRQGTS